MYYKIIVKITHLWHRHSRNCYTHLIINEQSTEFWNIYTEDYSNFKSVNTAVLYSYMLSPLMLHTEQSKKWFVLFGASYCIIIEIFISHNQNPSPPASRPPGTPSLSRPLQGPASNSHRYCIRTLFLNIETYKCSSNDYAKQKVDPPPKKAPCRPFLRMGLVYSKVTRES